MENVFLIQAGDLISTSVQGVSGHVACVKFSFCFAICHCLTCPTHPPTCQIFNLECITVQLLEPGQLKYS